MSKSTCGIFCESEKSDVTAIYLPLVEVRVEASIVDVSARVTLCQVFENKSDEPTTRAKYVFPIPAQAAVCAFEMCTEDGRTITGVVKEKMKAAAIHENAIKQGRMTGLVEWATDDVFTISLGCLPAAQKVTTKITYIINLMNDEFTDQVRFFLPMCVGECYGELPATMLDASSPKFFSRIKITLYIQMKGAIRSVVSSTHPTLAALPYQEPGREPSQHRMVARFESLEYLEQDFVVSIQAQGLDEPRCFAERNEKRKTTAMQLALVPKFDLPPIPSQEYIFLIDRSGSMKGNRIEMARRTLMMLLRALPVKGTTFNIFSFGSHSSKIFPESMVYSQATLHSATEHVDSMKADYGGTEMRAALSKVFESRTVTAPTAVFVLTDGETYDIDATLQSVSKAVETSSETAPLRVFTLGIGRGASSAMCEGIARTGNGICLFALESDNILRKTAKLVRASRTFIIKNISIDWGLPNPQDSTDPNLRIIQAPDNIVSIYPGVRFLVTALIHDESYSIPQEVILRGQRDGKGEMIEVKVPVCQIELSSDDSSVPFIHTLSARRLITQLEDQQYRSDCSAEWRQALITRFGEEYQLASRHTSFVAVGDIEPSDAEPFDNTNLLGEEDEEDGEDSDDEMGCLLVDDDYYYPPPTLAVSPPIIQPPLSIGRQYTPASPSHTPASPSSAQASPAYSPASLSYAPTPPLARNLPAELTTPDPLDCIPSVEEKARTTVSAPSVDDLIRLQSFNGSFSLSNKFREIFGKTTCDEGKRRGVGKATWATILAIAYLQRHLADQPDLLEELVEKAKDFVRISQSEADMQALVEIAKTLVH